jgi:cytochrome c-type biogenesis protein CcmH/NrfG
MAEEPSHQAQAYFDAGDFPRCRELALRSLATQPDDVRFLRLAGRCSLELELDDATDYLRQVVKLAPDDSTAWQDLGTALVDEGNMPEAAEAFRQVIRLRPDDVTALVNLGHTVHAMGQTDEAISYLSQATQREPGNLTALRGLGEMNRQAGRLPAALDSAMQIVRGQPDDVLATLDIADLNLALGNWDEAVAAFSRLRSIDAESGHEVYAYHGLIEVELQRQRWRRALDLAIDTTRVDRYDLTTQLLAFIVAQVFGESDRPAPTRAEVDTALAEQRAQHRRFHTEALVSG